MLVPTRTQSTTAMSLQVPSSSPPKRPRLSLQIKTPAAAQTLGKSSTALKADIDPSSPTAFNTLSNAYAVAIGNASPRTPMPPSAGLDPKPAKRTPLRLETKNFGDGYIHPSKRTQTPGPFSITYPDTPSSAFPSLSLTPTSAHPQPSKAASANSFTFTPPQSAGTSDHPQPRVFTFTTSNPATPTTPRATRRRVTIGSQAAPYTHPRALHSILRNSPLPPRTCITPATPSRMSMRIANRVAKKVEYNNPLTQTITTNKYVKSHIDLLHEDSPLTATEPEAGVLGILDTTMAYTGDETRDGGQTPGPFEEMRRRMADSGLETPAIKKRKRKDKKRKWEWTLGADRDREEEEPTLNHIKTPLTALRMEATPITAIRRGVSVSTDGSEDEGRYQPNVSGDDEEQDMRSESMTDSSEDGSSVASAQSEPIWPSSSFSMQSDVWHTIDL